MRLKSTFALLFFAASLPLYSQVVPAATDSESPFSVGGGLSAFNPDFDHGRIFGGTVWADYKLNKVPSYLHGIGLEVEARDIMLGKSSSQPSNLNEDTISGGVTYTWRHFRNVHPYGKVLWGYGNADYKTASGADYSQSRTVTTLGGGVDFRLSSRLWLRVDYEHQSWPDFFKHSATDGVTPPAGLLNPQGLTFGVTYHFGHKHPSE